MFFCQALEIVSLKVRQYFFWKNIFLEEAFLSHCATGRQSLKIPKACRKIRKFLPESVHLHRTKVGKKHFLSRNSRYAEGKFEKPEKTGKYPKHFSSESEKLNQKLIYSKTLSNIFLNSLICTKKNAGLTNLPQTFGQIAKLFLKINIAEKTPFQNSSEHVEGNFVNLGEKMSPNLHNYLAKIRKST